MSYEMMRSELRDQLDRDGCQDADAVIRALDRIAVAYSVTRTGTDLSTVTEDGLPEIVKTYIVCRLYEGVSRKTADGWKYILGDYCRHLGKPVQQATTNDIRVYLIRYKERRHISDRTLETKRGTISSFYKWLAQENQIPSNPCASIKPIKYHVNPRLALDQMETAMVQEACEGIRERAIVEMLLSTGIRIGELETASRRDIDWKTNAITVTGKGNKTRTVRFSDKSGLLLKEYFLSREDDNDALFVSDRAPHTRLCRKTYERMIEGIRVRRGIDKPLTPHILRHTFATRMVNAGAQITTVQKILGHASPATTMIYAEISDRMTFREHERCIG